MQRWSYGGKDRERDSLRSSPFKSEIQKFLTYVLYDPFRVDQVHTKLVPKITKKWLVTFGLYK